AQHQSTTISQTRANCVFTAGFQRNVNYNEEGKFIKGYTRKREPVTDGVITIDMQEYPAGNYLLEVKGKRGSYRRGFFLQK
ncbi:MAG: hypothetical protein AAF804_19985, partial [Bacteroidota bacterium]